MLMQWNDEVKIAVSGLAGERHIVISDIGSRKSSQILFCLPGILEVKSTFLGLSSLIDQGYRIVTLDYCGRGNSDYLKHAKNYKISTYIEDVLAVYDYIIDSNKHENPLLKKFNQNVWRIQGKSIHLLGNSMGGLIAAVIANKKLPAIRSLILNDISSLIPWAGLFSLYGNLSQSSLQMPSYGNFSHSNELAKTLNVDPSLLKAVMQTTHLDIPFNNTMSGIEFTSLFKTLSIPICLIYSLESKLVNSSALHHFKKYAADAKLIGVKGSSHPVKFDDFVMQELSEFINQQK
jgi:pimeloyl-ACP methyl ester carboxylesterase